MFKRPHHQRIAHVLAALNSDVLAQHQCWFGGGTCIALRYGEYRESVDIDFLISDAAGYREIRQMLTGAQGLAPIVRAGAMPLQLARDVRADQYGIRTQVLMDGHAIKFEIVREARIELQAPTPQDQICGISALTELDLATSKLLANADRQADDGIFSRDLIDLAMMNLTVVQLRAAVSKAEQAYGKSICRDLAKAIDRAEQKVGWLDRCMQAMAMETPKAVLWQNIRNLRRVLPTAAPYNAG
jgi:hypothetical protein